MKSILLIGDSISLGYTPYLKEELKSKYNLCRVGNIEKSLLNLEASEYSNCGDSTQVINILKNEAKVSSYYDILLINCGLHDIRRTRETLEIQVPIESYKENLIQILNLSKMISDKVIWITTTPVIDSIHNNRGIGYLRYNSDVIQCNEVAKTVFKEENLIDLYNYVDKKDLYQYNDHVHFIDEVYKLQAKFISKFLF
ncbi:GDSL-like Lipase/Acylhydrolase family protein [Clostridium sporogenes]|uniref:SGNH/GDSL hydrolase family protein n=1 Tax=Clostridium TaxID=1485 RepID=UPI00090A6DFD|nr:MULTISPECIES: SGNH/GDSL hydrolase family protein [Clostridium]APF28757.1 GDSL-like Lipase/Acylhydrolase family protein [Clostridium sporogenes]MDI6918518.1 SGNH/GDSL hydrolase family protein [Clostridium botulinum]WMU96462.1 SGNH/GDSL hydrolase family protein [Clostridium botulinum]